MGLDEPVCDPQHGHARRGRPTRTREKEHGWVRHRVEREESDWQELRGVALLQKLPDEITRMVIEIRRDQDQKTERDERACSQRICDKRAALLVS